MFYRINKIWKLNGKEFFARSYQLFAYQGACRNRLQVDIERIQSKSNDWKSRLNRHNQGFGEYSGKDTKVDGSREELDKSGLSEFIEFG